mmetsp:Transcript_881/g.2490  ORF Transcript_881/g.2490 Transcript_881/m.2490 type:complete len:150 (-) Transcript_881:212-661(-)
MAARRTSEAIAPAVAEGANIMMFSDIHRYLMQRHADLEWLRAQHVRKDKQRRDAIDECKRSLEHDTQERTSQIARFSEEMQKHTNRKIDSLQKDNYEHEVASKKGDNEMQYQIDRMVRELDSMHYGLSAVADAMETLCNECCLTEAGRS